MEAPIFCRPAGVEFFAQLLEPIDISLGGLRIYSHEEHPLGSALRLDVFFPHLAPVTLTAQVMWSHALGKGAPARFDLGLAFVGVHPDVVNLLQTWLGPDGEVGPRESRVEPVRGPVDSSVQYRQTESSREFRRETSDPPPSSAGPSPKVREPQEQGPTSAAAVLGAIARSEVSKKTHDPVAEMRECFSRGDYVGALAIVDLLLAIQPDDRLSRAFRANCCAALEDLYAVRLGPLDRIPVVVTLPEPADSLGSDRTRRLLSLMDGSSTLETVLNVCEVPRLDALRILLSLVQSRNIAFK